MRIRAVLLASSASLVLAFAFAFALAACGGGGGGNQVVIPSAGGDAGAEAGASPFATTAPPAGLPPMAPMPPPGVAGSKKAKRKSDGAMFACGGGAKAAAKDPVKHVKRIGEACAAATKMKPVGAPIRGQQSDKDPHAEHKLRVEANKCYRVYIASDEGVKDIVAAVRDSNGDMVAESNGNAAVPHDGAMCFTTADEVTLMIGVGAGKGSYAAQVWSD